jgi:hypothetical protein
MSPEQALGEVLDFRSDQFAFGAILYEMAAGKRAFARRSAPETMTAIIREEPEPLATAARETPIPLRWVVERCLAKNREERYGSTKDLARDLARIRDGASQGSLSGAAAPIAVPAARRGGGREFALRAAALAAGVAIGLFAARRPPPEPPTYHPLTFRRGRLDNARFAPDGKTVVYTAAWQGQPAQIYSTRLDSTESTALPLPNGPNILSISGAGKLALLLDGDPPVIAEASLAGGAPRQLVEAQWSQVPGGGIAADWTPGGDRLAIVREGQLEFPVGQVLVPASSESQIYALRFSPDGRLIAFLEKRRGNLDAVGVVDLAGRKRILSEGWGTALSLAWHPGTGEIWFSAREGAGSMGVIELYAVSPSGRRRTVAQTPQLLIVEDIARDGRVLARSDDWPTTMMCLPPGASRELDLTWLDFSLGKALSDDGQNLVFTEGGAAVGAKGAVYIRKTDGSSSAVRLGEGTNAQDLSPDQKWVLEVSADRLVLLPAGPGEAKTIRDEGLAYRRANWFPDGRRLLVEAVAPGRGPRLYVRDLSGGPPRPVTPEGTIGGHLSPDGKLLVALDTKDGKSALYPIDGGEPRSVPGIRAGERVIRFDASGQGLFVSYGDLPLHIDRLDLASGKRSSWKDIVLADSTGVDTVRTVQLTPDGKSYCYSFNRALSRLYAIDGLR